MKTVSPSPQRQKPPSTRTGVSHLQLNPLKTSLNPKLVRKPDQLEDLHYLRAHVPDLHLTLLLHDLHRRQQDAQPGTRNKNKLLKIENKLLHTLKRRLKLPLKLG